MTETDLRERVARAICDAIDGGPFSDREWAAFYETTREIYREAADAAINEIAAEETA